MLPSNALPLTISPAACNQPPVLVPFMTAHAWLSDLLLRLTVAHLLVVIQLRIVVEVFLPHTSRPYDQQALVHFGAVTSTLAWTTCPCCRSGRSSGSRWHRLDRVGAVAVVGDAVVEPGTGPDRPYPPQCRRTKTA